MVMAEAEAAVVGSMIYVGHCGIGSVVMWYENCESSTGVKVK